MKTDQLDYAGINISPNYGMNVQTGISILIFSTEIRPNLRFQNCHYMIEGSLRDCLLLTCVKVCLGLIERMSAPQS